MKYAILLLCLFAVGCDSGKSDNKEKLKPLAANQYDKLAAFSQSLTNSVGAALEAGNLVEEEVPSSISFSILRAKTSQDQVDHLIENCEFASDMPEIPEDPPSPFTETFEFSARGVTCPITMEVDGKIHLTHTQTSASANTDMRLAYEARDQAYAEETNVNKMRLLGDFQIEAGLEKFSISGSYRGTVSTRSFGEVDVVYKVSGKDTESASVYATAIKYRFSDFTAVGKVVETCPHDDECATKCTINDVPVSEEEFYTAFLDAGAISMSSLEQTFTEIQNEIVYLKSTLKR